MYHPTLGRFLQRDPIGYPDGMNTYAAYHLLWGWVDAFGNQAESNRAHVVLVPSKYKENIEDKFEDHNRRNLLNVQDDRDWILFQVDGITDANMQLRDAECDCIEAITIIGHGGTGYQFVGSTKRSGFRAGIHSFGVKYDYPTDDKGELMFEQVRKYGFHIFDEVSFCDECVIVLRGCYTASDEIGELFYKLIADETGCKVEGYNCRTRAGRDGDFSGSLSEKDSKPTVSFSPGEDKVVKRYRDSTDPEHKKKLSER